MRIYGLSVDECTTIVEAVSALRYSGNVIVKNANAISTRSANVSIRTKDSRAYGSRFAPSGRFTPAASWEVFRDVIEGWFVAGATKVETMYATYTSLDNFLDEYPATRWTQVGPPIAPVALGELTI